MSRSLAAGLLASALILLSAGTASAAPPSGTGSQPVTIPRTDVVGYNAKANIVRLADKTVIKYDEDDIFYEVFLFGLEDGSFDCGNGIGGQASMSAWEDDLRVFDSRAVRVEGTYDKHGASTLYVFTYGELDLCTARNYGSH